MMIFQLFCERITPLHVCTRWLNLNIIPAHISHLSCLAIIPCVNFIGPVVYIEVNVLYPTHSSHLTGVGQLLQTPVSQGFHVPNDPAAKCHCRLTSSAHAYSWEEQHSYTSSSKIHLSPLGKQLRKIYSSTSKTRHFKMGMHCILCRMDMIWSGLVNLN